MKIILLEKISKLGGLGNIVDVKKGFARNFLLPQKKALRATDENIAYFEKQKTQLIAKNEEGKKAAESVFKKIDSLELVMIKQSSETGVLYGSVSTKDIADELTAKKLDIKKNQIILNHPIKNTGIYFIEVKLHPEVIAKIKLNVARSLDEAKQAVEDLAKPVKKETVKKAEVKEEEIAQEEAIETEIAEEKETEQV